MVQHATIYYILTESMLSNLLLNELTESALTLLCCDKLLVSIVSYSSCVTG